MTDKPTTLSLDATEWRGLLSQNLVRAHEFVQSGTTLSADGVKALHDHMDRMKALVSAWHHSAPAPAAGAVAPAPQPEAPAAAKANGVAPKRKGGWPKGVSRKQRLNPAVVQ